MTGYYGYKLYAMSNNHSESGDFALKESGNYPLKEGYEVYWSGLLWNMI
jgi:hypothetical protein